MSDRDAVTSVRILGEEYRIRGASPERVATIADYVDAKFREFETAGSAVDLKRRAILVSLNIAEEVFQEKEQREEDRLRHETESRSHEGQRRAWQRRVRQCAARLDAVPDPPRDA